MQAKPSGWRRATTVNNIAHPSYTEDKSDLFEAARLAARVLTLPSSCRYILDQLCAAYGGSAFEGRLIVWPSNNWIEMRTGIKERTIRFALRRLIDLGVIEAKDSPNGKRYARRDHSGRIIAAYGFDLTPLLHQVSAFRDRLVEIEEQERHRQRVFDDLTIHRRNALEALHRLSDDFPAVDITGYTKRAETLAETLPRRSSKVVPIDAAGLWKNLYEELKAEIIAASAGNNCRHKDTNKNTLKDLCYKGSEVDKPEVLAKCPDAVEILGGFRHEGEMFDHADYYRGMLGVSKDAWLEARRLLGDEDAARLLYLVTQIQAKPAEGAQQIRNFGGYFRAMTRMITEGAVDLDREISRRDGQ